MSIDRGDRDRAAPTGTGPLNLGGKLKAQENFLNFPALFRVYSHRMPDYRIYTLIHANKIAGPPRLITCASDQAAIREAKTHLTDRDIEIWEGSRVVTRLKPTDK